MDDSRHLADLLDPSTKKQVVEEIQENKEAEELENVLYDLIAVECDVLAYVGGFLVKSTDECNDCKAALVGNDKYSTLIQHKEYALKNSFSLAEL